MSIVNSLSARPVAAPPERIISTNPATGQKIGEVSVTRPDEIAAMMAAARRAQPDWFRAGLRHRLEAIRSLKDAMQRNLDAVVNILVTELGKPSFEALTEFWPSIELLAFYLRNAPAALAPRRVFVALAPHRMHWVERRPYGVVLVIAPWNFPVLLSLAPIAAALLTGNTVIYKPSEYATQTGELLARLIAEAGIPRGVFQIAHGAGDVGAALIAARPDKICFTGSAAAGRKVAAAAGERLIPVTLELGAKDAAIVLEDADLDRAALGIVWGGMYNAGQACLSIERVYVARRVAEPFVQKMAKVIEEHIHIGPGDDHETTMGAITTEAQVNVIASHVQEAVSQGARLILGGRQAQNGSGRYYLPTLLTDVTPDMRVVKDETFGPVIAVIPFDDEAEAVEQVNRSAYGLTGSVWTRNRARGLSLAAQLEVGHASVNDHIMSASLPNLPWGGAKDSGYGTTRGTEGLYDMTRPQSFSIERFAPLPAEYFWYPYTPFKYGLLRRMIRFLYAPTWAERIKALLSR